MHATPTSAVASTVAIDLAKDVFELTFADAQGRVIERKRLSRSAFATALDNPARQETMSRRFGLRIGRRVRRPGSRRVRVPTGRR